MARIYADELKRAAELIRRAVFESQVREAIKGKTGAAKFVRDELKVEQALQHRPREAAPPPAPVRKGKKELQQEAADRVGGLYAPGRPPQQPLN